MIKVARQSASKKVNFEKCKDDWVLGTRTISEMTPYEAHKILVREMKRKGTYIRIKPNQISLCRQRFLNGKLNKQVWFVFDGKKKEMSRLVLKAKKALVSKLACIHAGAEKIGLNKISFSGDWHRSYLGYLGYGSVFHEGDIIQGIG